MMRYHPTITLLLVLLLSNVVVFTQKPGRQKPAHQNKQAQRLVDDGNKLLDDGKWDEARAAYESALRVDSQNADAYIGLGDVYMGTGKWKEALDAYKKAVTIAPRSADAQYALGDAYNRMGMHGDAFAPLVKATQLDPTFAEAFYGIGYAYLSGEQYEKSLSFLKRAISLKPDYDDAHYGLAIAYLHLGNQTGLGDERKKLIVLNPTLSGKLNAEISRISPTANETSVLSAAAPSPIVNSTGESAKQQPSFSPSPASRERRTASPPKDEASFEVALWESIKGSKDRTDFEYYLRKYPNGRFAELARTKMRMTPLPAPTQTPSKVRSDSRVTSISRAPANQNRVGARPKLTVVVGHSVPVSALAFSPDERILASGDGEGAIKIWDVKSGGGLEIIAEANNLTVNNRAVSSFAFSPDGKLLAAALVQTTDLSDDPNTKSSTEIGIWDLASRRLLRTLSGINVRIETIAFSPDGRLLASGGASTNISLWDVSSGKVVSSFTGSAPVVYVIQFSSNGNEVLSGNWGTSIDLWNASTGSLVKHVPGNPQLAAPPIFHTGPIFNSARNRFAVAPFGSLQTTLGTVIVGEWPSMKTLREFKQQNASTTSLAFSSSGSTVASGNNNGDIRIWNVDSGTELSTINKGFSSEIISMSTDNKMIAQVSEEGKSIRLWDTANQTTVKELSGHSEDINSLAFSPDNKTLASSSDDKTIRLWDLQNGSVKVLTGHTQGVGPIAFHPSGKLLVSVSDNSDYEGEDDPIDNTVRIWKVEDGTQIVAIPDPAIPLSLGFSPDGETLAIGNRDGTIVLLVPASQKPPKTLKSSGQIISVAFLNADMIQSIRLSEDETTGEIDFWNITTGQLLKTTKITENTTSNTEKMAIGGFLPFMGISGQFYVMPVKGNGISLFPRTTLEVDPFHQQELATLYLLEDNNWLIVTPDGLFDGTPAAWSRAIWSFANNSLDHAPVESFFNEFYYPGLLTDILAGKNPKASADIGTKDRRQPQVKVTTSDPQSSGFFNTRDLHVQVSISLAPAGAQDVRLFRNGSLVKVWHGDVLKGQTTVNLPATISIVAGENKLTAYAFNRDNVKSLDATLTVTGSNGLKRKGTAYVLAVGVNEYANVEYNLKYAVADAQDFAAETKAQQTKLNNYERVEIISLSDAQATKANLLKSLSDLSAKVQPEDALVIYFAGHGTAQENRFYLIPYDLGYTGRRTQLDADSLRSILAHSISDEELQSAVEGLDAGQMIMVIDACNSGQALESEEKRRGPMNSKGLAQLAYEKGMYILTAAQSYQAANEAVRLGHGYLTYALIEEGLKTTAADSQPRDGRVLIREWLNYVTARVPAMQQEELDQEQKQGRQLDRVKFAETDIGNDRSLQRPRVFYRREEDAQPLVVSITGENTANSSSDAGSRPSEFIAWKRIENSSNPSDFEEYIKSYPNGLYVGEARHRAQKLRDSFPANNSSERFSSNASSAANITIETIENKYNRGQIDEVINDARVFLQQQPDNAKVNMMLGFALLGRRRETEGFTYLDKGYLAGEPVTINVRRHRFVGPLLQDGAFDIGLDGLIMRYGDEIYSASFDRITNFEARNYGQSGIGLFVKGKFFNRSGKEEGKDFNLFAPTAGVRQVLQGLTMVPIVSCFNCDGWTNSTVNLFSHLRLVHGNHFRNRESSLSQSNKSGAAYSTDEKVFNVSHWHMGLVNSLAYTGQLYVSSRGIRFIETAVGGNTGDNFSVSCGEIKELSLSDALTKKEYKRINCKHLHFKIGGRNYNFDGDPLESCSQGQYRTPAIVKAIADACGIAPR